MPPKPDRSLIWLGKYLSLALTLPASVAAGYILASFLNKWLHYSFLPAVGILLGLCAGVVQTLREVFRETKPDGQGRGQ